MLTRISHAPLLAHVAGLRNGCGDESSSRNLTPRLRRSDREFVRRPQSDITSRTLHKGTANGCTRCSRVSHGPFGRVANLASADLTYSEAML